jgi:DNA-binding MarR family transcriptional regulator
MTSQASQELVSTPWNLFSVLSHKESLELFAMAKEGLKITPSVIDKLNISPKAYYRILKQLKGAGLVEKKKDKAGVIMYFHTTFGSIVYQRNIVETTHYMQNLQKMQMIDTVRQAEKFSEADILKLSQEIMDNIPSATSRSVNNVDIIMSFDKVIQKLLERIDCSKNEILISTRICPEIVINRLLEKSKLGVKVKVIADIDLVEEYLKSQGKFVDDLNKENPIEERKCVVANPWYPGNNNVHRRIAEIPFGVIILDNYEVGIELVNSNNVKEFCGGIFIRDEKMAIAMNEFYQQLWEKASENVGVSPPPASA